MIEPKPYDASQIPAITWAGQKWPIPELAAKQLDELWDAMRSVTAALDCDTPEKFGAKLMSLDGKQFKELRGIVYVGLTRAHPNITREEFDDVPTSTAEMASAFLVVRTQSKMYGRAISATATSTGEVKAAENPTSSELSPVPAAISTEVGIIGGQS